jgi:protein involved in plasmid replication-relaxation
MTTDVTADPPRRKRRFVREAPDPFQLTERDMALIRLVAQHRFLRSTHLSDLCQAPHKKVCDRLTRLFHAGYLDRPRAQFEAFRDGGGSCAMVYALGNRGARLLIEHGVDAAELDWTRKNDRAGRQFIQHTLAISDVRVSLQRAIRERPGFQILEPSQLLEMAPQDTRRREQPWMMRAKVHCNDGVYDLGVAPDYVFAVGTPDRRFRTFLVECDRGTMPVERGTLMQTSLKRKFLTYASAKRHGVHTRQYGWKAFRVLVITSNRQRADHILATIRTCAQAHDRGLFLVADRVSLSGTDIFSHAWRDARGQMHALI